MRISRWNGYLLGSAILSTVVLLVVGCGQSSQMTRAPTPAGGLTVDALEALPFESLSDWRSYADQVSVVHIDSERATPDPAQAGQPDRYIIRTVAATVEKTLWSRGVPAKRIDFQTWGWQERSGQRIPVSTADGPRLEVGRRYVIAFTHSGAEWAAQTSSSVLPLNGDVIATGHTTAPAAAGPAATAPAAQVLDGLSVKQLAQRLSSAQPDPVAAKYSNLPAELRIRKVQEAEAQQGQ